MGEAEEGAVLPQEKGAVEPCEDRQEVPPRARPSVSEDQAGQATAVTEGRGSKTRMGELPPRRLSQRALDELLRMLAPSLGNRESQVPELLMRPGEAGMWAKHFHAAGHGTAGQSKTQPGNQGTCWAAS